MKYFSTDKNHVEIVQNLKRFGFAVTDNADSGKGRLDILVCKIPSETIAIEIKYGRDAEFKRSQIEWLANWKGYCGYGRNFEQILNICTNPRLYALTDKEKEKMLAWLRLNPCVKTVGLNKFEKEVFGELRTWAKDETSKK